MLLLSLLHSAMYYALGIQGKKDKDLICTYSVDGIHTFKYKINNSASLFGKCLKEKCTMGWESIMD